MNILKTAANGTLLFGISYGIGKAFGSPQPLQGAITATVSFVAHQAINHVVNALESKFNWKESTTKFTKVLCNAIVATAMAATLVAIGSLNLLGLGIFTLLSLYHIGLDLYSGIRTKVKGDDLTYQDRIKKEIQSLKEAGPKAEAEIVAAEEISEFLKNKENEEQDPYKKEFFKNKISQINRILLMRKNISTECQKSTHQEKIDRLERLIRA